MSISSQLPPISLAQASANLRALAQAAGQTVEARVLSQSRNGLSQVQIGRQTFNLALPQGQVVGSTLTLSVQQSDGQLRLAIVAIRPPATPAATPVAPGVVSSPATSVQLSAAALASPSLTPAASSAAPIASTASPSVPGAQANAVQSAAAAPSSAAIPGPGQAHGASTVPVPPQTATVAPVAVSPPNGATAQSGAAAAAAPSPAPASPVAPPAGAAALQGSAASNPTGLTATNASAVQNAAPPLAASGAGLAPLSPAAAGVAPVRADIPYAVAAPAVAAPAVAAPQVTAITGSAASGLPPVAQMAAGTMVGQHAPSPNAPLSTPAGVTMQSGGGAAVPAPPLQTATPQAAIAQMVQQSLPRQDSIVGLTTALTAIAGKVALPEPVAKAAQQVLAARLPLDGAKLTGAGIRSAVQLSGVFQEALLASGQGQAAAGDLKSALLSLRQTLGAWLGNQAAVTQISGLAPPIRGHMPRAKSGDGAPPGLPDDPLEMGKVLSERTDAALSRVRLHQNASLPDPSANRQDAQWSMDLPVIVGGQQQVLHLQIQRDAEQEAERSEERSWQVRFAINLADRGEVGAQISLRAKNTGVLLWADREDTARSLAAAVDGLREELGDAGLVAGATVVRAGAPVTEAPQPVASDGHVLDATR